VKAFGLPHASPFVWLKRHPLHGWRGSVFKGLGVTAFTRPKERGTIAVLKSLEDLANAL
jgi:hypothetical protein